MILCKVAPSYRRHDLVLVRLKVLLCDGHVAVIERRLKDHDVVAAVPVDLSGPGLPERVGAEAPVVLDAGGRKGRVHDAPGAFAGEGAQVPLPVRFPAEEERHPWA